MRKINFVILIMLALFGAFSQAAFAENTTYYVSPSGDDKNSGTSEKEAWRTLERVNEMTFRPGDSILLEAGGIWNGRLMPQGNGEEGRKITVASYGEGAKPIINGGGISGKLGGAVALYNQSYWTVRDLELTNKAPEGDEEPAWRCGIIAYVQEYTAYDIEFLNLTVHDVDGTTTRIDGEDTHWNGGIVARGYSIGARGTRIEGLRIEGCEVYNVSRTGITSCMNFGNTGDTNSSWMSKNLVIRNNVVHHIAGDGIIAAGDDGGVVEHNVTYEVNLGDCGVNIGIWGIHSHNTVFQFNEAYLTRTTNDGMGYDIDGLCKNVTFQYNYSHDNEGGFMLLVNINNDGKHTVRYNISQNDHRFGIASFGTHKNKVSATIYNNTIYTDPWVKQHPLGTTEDLGDIYFYNNIFCSLGGWDYWRPDEGIWDSNAYFGHDADKMARRDANAVVADPRLVAAGSGKTGIDSVDGYMLFEDSPLLGAGRVIEDNGGRDYWGNPVDKRKKPNIGAYNGAGISYADKAMTDKAREMSYVLKIGEDSFTSRGERKSVDTERGGTAYVADGVTMVPISFFENAFGAELCWNFEKQTAELVYCGRKYEFSPQSTNAASYGCYYTSVNEDVVYYPEGSGIELGAAPEVRGAVLYVPLRPVAEKIGKSVLWNDGEIIITGNARLYEGI